MIKEYFAISFRSVFSHKVRAILTTLGVVIGVASVILLMSLGNSAREEAANQIRSIGSNLVYVQVRDSEGNLPVNWLDLIKDDAKIDAYSPLISNSATYIVEGQSQTITISGVNEDYAYINSLDMTSGRFLSKEDMDYSVPSVVVGSKIPNLLFPNQEVLGNTLLIKGMPFTIVGVVEERGTNFGGDNDLMVYISSKLATRMAGNASFAKVYYIAAESEETIDFTLNRIETYLLSIFPSDDYFGAFSQSQILSVLDTLMGLLTTLLSGIASISLIVGGIGIMNIMLVTVRERTKEIGIRKALGARQSQILLQFLIEAVIITVLGGLFGLIVSYLGALLITFLTDFTVTLGWSAVTISLGFSLTIGLIFGIYPAYTASKLEPVEALRFE